MFTKTIFISSLSLVSQSEVSSLKKPTELFGARGGCHWRRVRRKSRLHPAFRRDGGAL